MIPLIVISFFIIIIIVGFSSNKNKSTTDYIFSGRKLTVPALVATLVTTWYGGINEIGNQTVENGIVVWLYFCFCYYISVPTSIVFTFWCYAFCQMNSLLIYL